MNLTKIVSKDELQPALNCAVLMNGYFYATEGHILIKIKAEDAFTLETDNKVFDLDNLKVIARAKDIIFKDEYFLASGRKYRYAGTINPETRKITMDEFSCFAHADGGTYPDVESVLSTDKPTELHEIGLNPVLLERLCKGFVGNTTGAVRLEFQGTTRAIKVNPIGTNIEEYGIIMPAVIGSK